MMGSLLISQLAKAADLPVATIRYYERRRLLPPPPRSAAGYRIYPEDAVGRVRFVRRAKGLGFSLNEIRKLLASRDTEPEVCKRTRDQAETTIERIGTRIRELEGMRDELLRLIGSCDTNLSRKECPIIDSLEDIDVGDC